MRNPTLRFENYSNSHERLTSVEEAKPRSIKDEIERIQLVFNNNPRYRTIAKLP